MNSAKTNKLIQKAAGISKGTNNGKHWEHGLRNKGG